MAFNLYGLTNEVLALRDECFDMETGEVTDDERILAFLDKRQNDLAEAVADIGRMIKERKAFISLEKDEKTKIAEMQKRDESKLKTIIKTLTEAMLKVGLTKVERPDIKMSFRKSEGLVILDETKVPDEFKVAVTTYVIDTDKIKNLLKSGAELDFAYLEQRQNLQIK